MAISASILHPFADGRFDANLLVFYGLMVATVLTWLALRRLLIQGSKRLAHWTRLRWLDQLGEEASRRARTFLFWLSLAVLALICVGGITYHWAGGDVRKDLLSWYEQLTAEELFFLGVKAVGLVLLVLAGWVAGWVVRRGRPILAKQVEHWVGKTEHVKAWRRWMDLLERYLRTAFRLLTLWAAARVVGLAGLAAVLGFLLRIVTILALARLLTLTFRNASRPLASLGDRYLAKNYLQYYWEPIKRLIPFGVSCLEAAVYITAASLCVAELHFIDMIADFGPKIVTCIGILFGTRVLIELLQVLLNQAFGLYHENRHLDSKGRTLVPLLYSVCQYVLYFGSGVVMLGVLGIDTRPILAGAGILGLAVGLGAQNLVTDVVSGFFILFENQYLVGDFVQIGDAQGIVEAVGIRLTQVRDGEGKLHIIPNGQIKGVVNYSKGYVNAVVDVRVPSGSDLEGVFRAMTEAGRRLRHSHPEVLADTEIQGLVELSSSEMTIRAVTKVRPGNHRSIQNEYRRLLKQLFDEQKASKPASLAA